jgi:hypothetical protein
MLAAIAIAQVLLSWTWLLDLSARSPATSRRQAGMRDKFITSLSALFLLTLAIAQVRGPRPTVIDPEQVRGGIQSGAGAVVLPAGFNISIPSFAAPDVFVVQNDGSQPQTFTARGVPAGALYVFRNGVLQVQNTDFVPSYSTGYSISFPGLKTGDVITLVYQVMQQQWIALPLPAPGTAH